MGDNYANSLIYQPERECAATWVCKWDTCPSYFLRVLRGTWTQKSKNQTDLIPDSCPREAVWHQTLWLVGTYCVKLDIWNYLPGEIHCPSWSGSPWISALSWHPCNVRRIGIYRFPPKQVALRTCEISSTAVRCAAPAHIYSLFFVSF